LTDFDEIWQADAEPVSSTQQPLKIQNYKFQMVETICLLWRTNMRHNARFHQNPLNSCIDMAILQFPKMAAVHRLGFLKLKSFNGQDG